jgi:signal transduction histidine kinase
MVHPVGIFVMMQIIWTSILALWVVWFVARRRELEHIALPITPASLPVYDGSLLILIVVGIILLAILGAGSIMLFIWGQRQTSLIQQQRHFVSSVTHELRTPLASIQLAYETMTERTLPEATKQKLLNMSRIDIERLIRLVNQILISSRLDRGLAMFKDDVEDLSIADATREILHSLTHLDANITERVDLINTQNISWHGSKNAFNIVLSNLLENALKYSAMKSKITITAENDGRDFIISVQDSGIGLSKRDKKKIFKMFYRSTDVTQRAIQGTGLGLFIVKTTLEQLGGTITVVSTGSGYGCIFKAKFPA